LHLLAGAQGYKASPILWEDLEFQFSTAPSLHFKLPADFFSIRHERSAWCPTIEPGHVDAAVAGALLTPYVVVKVDTATVELGVIEVTWVHRFQRGLARANDIEIHHSS